MSVPHATPLPSSPHPPSSSLCPPFAQSVTGEGIEVTSLAWALDGLDGRWRTFASHLDGTLSEVDWRAGALAGTLDSSGGVIWALAAQPWGAVKPGGCMRARHYATCAVPAAGEGGPEGVHKWLPSQVRGLVEFMRARHVPRWLHQQGGGMRGCESWCGGRWC